MKFLRHKLLVLIVILSAVSAQAASENNLHAIWLNQSGKALLLEQNFAEAFQHFAQALEYSPFAPELHLNMGLALEGQGQGDRALKAYMTALSFAKVPEVKFQALFNLAQLYGKAKRYDEALHFYQQALEIVPTSQEVKINIELLIKDQQQQQQQQGQGEDKKDQNGGQGDNKDQKENQDNKGDKGEKPKDGPKKYADNPKPQPKPFKGENLSEGDVKKILGELKNQEQKIRREYYKKDVKDKGRDKDW